MRRSVRHRAAAPPLSWRTRIAAAAGAAICAFGCAPPARPPAPVPPMGREFVSDYNRIASVVLADRGKQWVVLPHSVAVFDGDLLRLVVGKRAGLAGPIVAVQQDPLRVWLGTAQGVFVLDKADDYLKSFTAGSPMDNHVVALGVDLAAPGTAWAVTRAGVLKVDYEFGTTESFPFEQPLLPRSDLVAMDPEFVWVGHAGGILRFSKRWGRWDASYTLLDGSSAPLRLAVDGRSRIWAITEGALFQYDRRFDSWRRTAE